MISTVRRLSQEAHLFEASLGYTETLQKGGARGEMVILYKLTEQGRFRIESEFH